LTVTDDGVELFVGAVPVVLVATEPTKLNRNFAMTESPPPPHDFTDHKQHMQWLVEREKYAQTVPMIPQDFSKGSHSKSMSSTVLQRALSNPFVPIGMAATVGCLVGMLSATLKRKPNQAQLFMRGRCLAQGFTVAALVYGAIYFGLKPEGMGVSVEDRTSSFPGKMNKA
uniref:HIG1 domain-containing protein n=1 Tax=Haemonchus placei TaxID=6290 RepID=A0A0N4VUJ1_HAEPC